MATFAENAEKTVKAYFDAWRTHDLAALDGIFADDAEYVIEGKETFQSLAHIRSYWSRNAQRQANVGINYNCLPGTATNKKCQVSFLTTFDDNELARKVAISGTGVFEFGDDGLCRKFTETYQKYEARHWVLTSRELAQRLLVAPSRGLALRLAAAWGAAKTIARPLVYPTFLLAALISFMFAVYMNFVEGNWFTYFTDPQATTKANRIANGAFIVSAVVQFVRDHYRRSPNDILIRRKIFDTEKTDLKIMADEMKGASEVTIYSGDFSFISNHAPLLTTLRDLADSGNLTLISHKSEDSVKNRAASSDHIHILAKLARRGKMHFDSPHAAKYSIISRPGSKSLLFRFVDNDGGYVGIIRSNSNVSHALLDTMNAVTSAIAAKLKP